MNPVSQASGSYFVENNYEVWPGGHFEWPSIVAFLDSGSWLDGVHTVKMTAGPSLDLFFSGGPLANGTGTIPVFFNGAVSGRESKLGPFFSGRRISSMGNFGFISISDPSVNLDPSLGLAWYAGSMHQDLQVSITMILREIASRYGELLLIGGSGGGFASLFYGHRLGDLASALVWNPQTSVTEYNPVFVKNYISHAFGSDAGLETDGWKQIARSRAELSGVALDALKSDVRRLLYMQNGSDWHTPVHAAPFLVAGGFTHSGNGLYRTDDDHIVWVANYGTGHTPLPENVLLTAIQTMRDPQSTVQNTTERIKSSWARGAEVLAPGWPRVSHILPLNTKLHDLTKSHESSS